MSGFDEPRFLGFPGRRAAYSDRRAWAMAVLAHLAYLEPGPARDAELAKGGFRWVREFHKSDASADTHGYLAEHADFDALVFRGTDPEDAKNWITDLGARTLALDGGGLVHAGFHDAYELVREDVRAALAARDRALYVAGHSLGGALAVLAVYHHAAELGDRLAACYTFGCPRVGDVDFLARIYKAALYQAVDRDDVVPHLPPRLLSPFCDSGDLRRLLGEGADARAVKGWGSDLRQAALAALKRALVSVLFRFRALRGASLLVSPAALIGDHSISLYEEKLRLVAARNNPPRGAAGR